MSENHIVLPGGSGFLGDVLRRRFNTIGIPTVTLTRNPRLQDTMHNDVLWDGKTTGAWVDTLNRAKAIINLTGKSVNCRYTQENKDEILNSRVDSVKIIAKALNEVAEPPVHWIQSSSLSFYGNSRDTICSEKSPYGEGFSSDVVKQWEEAFFSSEIPKQVRKTSLRIGFVLGPKGGALRLLEKLTRVFLGGHAGLGNQYISWIHESDFFDMVSWSLARNSDGIYNATSPSPVTNSQFMSALRQALGRPWSPPIPEWAVKVGAAVFLRTEAELVLTGRRCIPERAIAEGFEFEHTDLSETLKAIYSVTAKKQNASQ